MPSLSSWTLVASMNLVNTVHWDAENAGLKSDGIETTWAGK